MSRARRRPRVFFSFRSPFSWMALRRMSERLGDLEEHVDLIPFFEPDAESAAELERRGGTFHYVAMSKAKHLYILNDTKRLAQRFGYDLVWPVDVDPWWELPHLAWLRARSLGCQREFYTAVTAARWERGENICEEPVLGATLGRAGLPVADLLAAPHDPDIRREGVDALLQVYQDDVFGVPYFRSGPHRFWGVDRVDDFLSVLLDGASPATGSGHPAPLARVGAYDHDTAGGCG